MNEDTQYGPCSDAAIFAAADRYTEQCQRETDEALEKADKELTYTEDSTRHCHTCRHILPCCDCLNQPQN